MTPDQQQPIDNSNNFFNKILLAIKSFFDKLMPKKKVQGINQPVYEPVVSEPESVPRQEPEIVKNENMLTGPNPVAFTTESKVEKYIREAKTCGMSDDEIRKELLAVGWTLSEINGALE